MKGGVLQQALWTWSFTLPYPGTQCRRHVHAAAVVHRWEPQGCAHLLHTSVPCAVGSRKRGSAARYYMPNSYYKLPHLAHVQPVVRALRNSL
jgi:hypothetical protein